MDCTYSYRLDHPRLEISINDNDHIFSNSSKIQDTFAIASTSIQLIISTFCIKCNIKEVNENTYTKFFVCLVNSKKTYNELKLPKMYLDPIKFLCNYKKRPRLKGHQ